jgi:CBS domain containing-hemolysin-like protein
MVQQEKRNAKLLQMIKSQPQRLLSTILVGNNIVNIGAASYATLIATEMFGDAGAGIAVGVMTLLILIFGEITPKALATAHNKKYSLRAAPYMSFLMKFMLPIVWVLERLTQKMLDVTNAPTESTVSEEEIKALIATSERQGSMDEEEAELLEKVFDFDDIKAEDAMTVFKDVFSADGDKLLVEELPRLASSTFSRIPIYIDEPNNIVGILRLREVLKFIGSSIRSGGIDETVKIRDLASKPYFVPENKSIDEILHEFKQRHKHIAVVVDEYGHTTGIITMEDILEQLVGQIADETDVDEYIIKRIDKNTILVDGDEEIDEVNDFFNVSLQGPKHNSVSWLLLQQTGDIPQNGEQFHLDGLTFIIEEVTDRKIEKVKIIKPV